MVQHVRTFPTRRSSDLLLSGGGGFRTRGGQAGHRTSGGASLRGCTALPPASAHFDAPRVDGGPVPTDNGDGAVFPNRSEEHTSELQLHVNIVCRLLPEK